ncbi:MAG: TonB-dependent receptor [Bryobacteraceae bacterium]|jgi:hypothetical protein
MKSTFGLFLLAVVCATGVYAQSVAGYGAVTGTVRDANGEGIPDSTVLLSNESMGVRRSMMSTDDGTFDAPSLAPGKGYSLKVTRKGFVDWKSTVFDVSIGQILNFTVMMQAEGGSIPEVDPARAVAPVDDTRVGVSTLVGRPQIDGLPTSDRRLDELVRMAPTVSTDSAHGVIAFQGLPFSNSFLLDGVSTANTYYFLRRPGIANQISQDAVEEVQVLVSDASSEFVRFMGGTVNTVTRSGGNSFHGAGYGYLAKPTLSSAERYAMGRSLFQKQDQEGGSVGGPVLPNKLFFFLNAEVLDADFQDMNRITSPMIANAAGTAVLASNCKASATICAAAAQFIQAQMNVVSPLSQRMATGLGKIDYRRSDRNTFGVEANALNSRFPEGAQTGNVAPDGGLLGIGNSRDDVRYGKASWIRAQTATSVNEARFGAFEDRFSGAASKTNLSTGNAGIDVAGVTLGANHPYASAFTERRYQLVDNFSLTALGHSLKLGFDASQTRDAINELANSNGTFFYSSLTAFAQDLTTVNSRNYSYFTQTLGDPVRSLRLREIHVYVQDTWKVTRNFTLSGGFLWEKTKTSQPTEMATPYYNTGTIPSRTLNLTPRASLAYLLSPRTAFRASYGWYYAPFTGQIVDALFLGNGIYQTNIVVNPNQSGALVFPKVFAPTATLPNGTPNIMYAASKVRQPYTQQTTVAIERRLTKDTALTVNLMNIRGFKLWTATDANLVAPTTTETYTIDNASNQATSTFATNVYTARNDGTKAHVFQVENGGSSWYDAVAVQLRKQVARTLSVQASYTWSHAIDDVSGTPVVPGIPSNFTPGSYSGDKGNSEADQRQRGTVNWLWQPTVIKSNSPFARFLVNGWEVSGIATLASPQHRTPVMIVGAQQFSGVTMTYTNSLNASGGWNRVPFEGVGSLSTGSNQYTVNGRLTRTLPFTERVKGMLMFEAFNVLNNQFITAINTLGYTTTAGVVKPAPGVGVGIASDGFPYGSAARRCQIAFRLEF